MTDCSFAGASLRDAAVGIWHNGRCNIGRRVSFAGTDFRVVAPLGAIFEDCDFSEARLAKVRFERCAITRCRFAGLLKEVVFDGQSLLAGWLIDESSSFCELGCRTILRLLPRCRPSPYLLALGVGDGLLTGLETRLPHVPACPIVSI